MIEWLLQSSADLPVGAPPPGLLTGLERARFEALRVDKRRDDWLLGRWTAKRLVQAHLARLLACEPPLDSFAVLAAADGAPELDLGRWLGPAQAPMSLSISHSRGRALCALACGAGLAVGCDIEQIEPRDAGFARDYFTADELALLSAAPAERRDALSAAVWSAKESALKVLRLGLTVDTRAVTCLPSQGVGEGGWAPVRISADARLIGRDAPAIRGWWRVDGDSILTLALSGEPR